MNGKIPLVPLFCFSLVINRLSLGNPEIRKQRQYLCYCAVFLSFLLPCMDNEDVSFGGGVWGGDSKWLAF